MHVYKYSDIGYNEQIRLDLRARYIRFLLYCFYRWIQISAQHNRPAESSGKKKRMKKVQINKYQCLQIKCRHGTSQHPSQSIPTYVDFSCPEIDVITVHPLQ